ncbi:PREDICTED: DNA replication factor Cdt1-like [Amphimedon queenslandica]|uniref:CDT1 Geminin-binding domain-containing protein n=1 Tax=Amphimedon queenslandica TaxID=400682 RepID=A0AAN0J006_AMPQE|nr:PREDICTED: DNA replication factor Cdt1-like [Amphimedon queenslandica]|eukprot:XP_019850046.1 PREDICTED: DNA replication factor Cdt1-like [Amphimedon queenslandica]
MSKSEKQTVLPFQVVKKRSDDERKVKKRLTENTCIRPTTTPKSTSGKKEKGKDEADVAPPPPPQALQTTPTKSPSLSKFSTVEVHSPLKASPHKEVKRGIKRALKYDDLTSVTTTTKNLQLPYRYRLLKEKFRCANVALSMLENRKETCTFRKLKKAVEEMTRRNFEMKDIAQMKYLFPESLVLRQEKNVPGSLTKEEFNNYQLTISSNIIKWSPTVLLEREKIFHDKLLSQTKMHHQAYLSSLKPPVYVPDDKLCNWHVKFELGSVPDPPEAEIPRPPVNESYNSASDLLKQTELKLSSRVKTALEKLNKESPQSSESPIPEATPTGILKGVSPALIERIRKKEATKAAIAMTRSDETEKQLIMLSRLSEMCRIIRQLFVTEGKAAILWSHLLQKISDSHSSNLSPGKILEKN